ncbi:DNA polymerase Y family protein [Pseudonocardia nigra]|uniref:DNA polymerase Y family protein n=1 Tax=Pseudonocardia nigra TaxID=1921578 RepID=UPI001C5D1C28|nr:DNA polymerase Y family protein [Pseudonocardia nigra]
MAAHVPAHRPAAVVVANRVLACSAVARAHGVRRGLRRREAQARCPDLVVLERDPDRDARAFEPVVVAVEELAPGVEVVRPGLVALAAQGPVGWFGGEQAAAERLVDQVAARTGAECQVGLADGLFAAVLAARRGLAVAQGDTPAFLAPLGVEELDREPDVDRSELVGLLHRLGLRSLGAFAALDAEDVASRFGADAVLCHRLARGLDPRPPVRRLPPEELTVELELDPPVDRVDAAAFAARGLAEQLHRTLAGHGLSCTQLGIAARTDTGEELHRVWRCAEPLTPAGTVDRVRWQLDAWITRSAERRAEAPDEPGGVGAVTRLWLVPEETVPAGALQLGLWGDVGESDERAGRALVRVQALLGPESVVTGVLVGGREPAEQVRLVPWGDDRDLGLPALPLEDPAPTERPAVAPPVGRPRQEAEKPATAAPAGWPEDVVRRAGRDPVAAGDDAARPRSTNRRRRTPAPRRSTRTSAVREPPPSWPGRVPAPSPATVPPQPLPAELLDAEGTAVALTAPDLLSASPHRLAVDDGSPRTVHGWAGPWPLRQRWWVPDGVEGSRLQVVVDGGAALLLLARDGRWWVTGIYD